MAFRSIFSKAHQQFRLKTANTRIITAMDDDDAVFEDAGSGTPLSEIANSFEELSAIVISSGDSDYDLRLKPFCDACSLVSILFGCLGIAFKFAEMEYTSKVRDLPEAAQSYETLNNDCSLKEAASTAYAKVCAPYHTWPVRTAVSAGMCALPTREQLLLKLNETEESAEKEMRRYIKASLPVIQYVDKLYISRNIGLDW